MTVTAQSWFVYIILSSDDRYYTGITTDVRRRWKEHSTGKAGAKFFRGRTPKKLLFVSNHESRSEASRREAEIKSFSRIQKTALLGSALNAVTAEFSDLTPC